MSISNTGFIIEPSQTAIDEAEQILIDTYGADVNLDPTSPNGLLVQNIALAITKRENDQADTVNAMNPNIATGTQLDAVCSNLSIERIAATKSTATCQLTGLVGTSIPALSQVASTNNDVFLIDTTTVISGGGTATVTVTAQDVGEISVAANTINKIITGVSGWSTVNNSGAGSVGTPEQTDTSLRLTRVDQLAASGSGSVEALTAGAQGLNPISFYVTENYTASNVVQDGITILAHSMLLVIEGGGSDATIANMILRKISGGAAMSGSTSYTVPIPNSAVPFIARWQQADPKVLKINLTLKLGSVYPANLTDLVASIINTQFSFNVIGQYIDATQFAYLLIGGGISPIRSLTFDVGSNTALTEYTMPISDSLGSSLLNTNVNIIYV